MSCEECRAEIERLENKITELETELEEVKEEKEDIRAEADKYYEALENIDFEISQII